MPTWITSRRLGAAVVLYAVFVGGWYLGQPLPDVGCHVRIGDPAQGPGDDRGPGDVAGDLSRSVQSVVTYQVVDTAVLVSCDGEPRPRLVAWVTGDWR